VSESQISRPREPNLPARLKTEAPVLKILKLKVCFFTVKYSNAPDIRSDNPAFFISGIQPDTGIGFDL
jgi:hypothetical protein